MYLTLVKPVVDRLVAAILLIVLAPVLVAIALCTAWIMGRPVIFRQPRPGFRGEVFTLMKFRTMREASDRAGAPLADDQRITGLGHFLRSTSLDELPELVNVLKGEMSLVGPRPLLCRYLDRYSADEARRHEIKPGITGWAQVNGRNGLTWEEKFKLDVWYVDNCSAFVDLKILLLTIWIVMRRQGIAQVGQATAREFMGHNK